jgi:tRNA dimethylallyltransferase
VLANTNTIIGVLGATASGKTKYAVRLAKEINAEIISMDSRQVYKELNLGVGKDLKEYDGVAYHLIDIISLHDQYHIHQFKKDFHKAYIDITSRGKRVIACGGTGLYFDVLLNNRIYTQVPVNEALRVELLELPKIELVQIIIDENTSNISFDTSTHKRCIRAIEIIRHLKDHTLKEDLDFTYEWELYALKLSAENRKQKIDQRLQKRIEQGLFEEVENLLKMGFTEERLVYLGLEYKFITEYFKGLYSKEECIQKLTIAIHQFSKRQLTFFRKIEKDGHLINWIEAF